MTTGPADIDLRSLARQPAEHVRDGKLSGALPGRVRLVETIQGESVGVSRSTARAALIGFMQEGLVAQNTYTWALMWDNMISEGQNLARHLRAQDSALGASDGEGA
jgi:DNA-binding GntR family transcriptional regulator